MAFIVAIAVVLGTLLVCGVGLMAAERSDSITATNDMRRAVLRWSVGGTIFALAIAATHWVVHASWW